MSLFTALLYAVCSALLLGAAVLVFSRAPRFAANRQFALTALWLLVWLATLFFFERTPAPSPTALLLGHLNFAAAVPAVLHGYLFVCALAGRRSNIRVSVLAAETVLLTTASLFTPLVDRAELMGGGTERHLTLYGFGFPLYAIHILAYVTAAILMALAARREARSPVRDQLALVAGGIVATSVVGVAANVVLPYAFGDFRFIDAGPLSTALFLLAVAYAVVRHRLFDIQLFVRRTLAYGLLLSFALAAYSSLIALVADRIASSEGGGALTRFGVLLIVSLFDPLPPTPGEAGQ